MVRKRGSEERIEGECLLGIDVERELENESKSMGSVNRRSVRGESIWSALHGASASES